MGRRMGLSTVDMDRTVLLCANETSSGASSLSLADSSAFLESSCTRSSFSSSASLDLRVFTMVTLLLLSCKWMIFYAE